MNYLLRILQQLTTPIVPISDTDKYQQSRMLASISLAVLLVALVGIFLSSPSYTPTQIVSVAPVVAGFLLFLVPYYQSRRGHLKSASIVIALIAFMLIFVAALSLGGDVGRDILHYNVLIILFSLVFLSRSYTLFFVCLNFALILLFGALNPALSIIGVIRGPLVFNFIGTFFIILLTTIWRRRELEKRQYLQASERQQAQLLLRREQYSLLAQFVDAVSHDLRTRLSLIETNRFFVKRMVEKSMNSEQVNNRLENIRGIIADIDNQIHNLNIIVNLGNPITERVDLNQIVMIVQNDFLPRAEKSGIRLETETLSSPVYVISNPEHLEVALSQLTQNAITYSNQGDTVTLTVRQTKLQGCVAVNDTGDGITDEHIEHVFDIFYKANIARTTSHSGLGLGLTIVKLIAEAYSGKVDVESVEGEGSTFTFCLPLESYETPRNLSSASDVSVVSPAE